MALYIRRLSDGKIIKIWKYIIGCDNEESIWSNGWYGRHVIGQDCAWAEQPDTEDGNCNKADIMPMRCSHPLHNRQKGNVCGTCGQVVKTTY